VDHCPDSRGIPGSDAGSSEYLFGKKFDVDSSRGLDGYCDYLISLNPEQYYISAPIFTIVEAKNEDIVGGFGQCIATMVAARLFNEREQQPLPWIYGAITTGTTWKFLKLHEQTVYLDRDEYYLKEIEVLMGIFCTIVLAPDQNPGL